MEIAQLRDLGCQIFLMINLNEKITPGTVIEIFSNIGLTEVITHSHPDTGMVPTYQRLSHPIYVIHTSITLQVSSGIYLPFGIIPLYHRLLWLKVEFDSAFGDKMDALVTHTARRLNFQNPDTVKLSI